MAYGNGSSDLIPVTTHDRERGVAVASTSYATREGTEDSVRAEVSLFDLLNFARKRVWLIAAITAASFAAGVTYCLITPPLYTSDTTVELRGYAPILSGVQSEVMFGTDSRKVEYQKTTVAKLKLDGLADEILSRDGLDGDLKEYFARRKSFLARAISKVKRTIAGKADIIPKTGDFDPHFVHHPSAIRRYLGLVDINPVHETNLVSISVTTGDPALSQRIANAHAIGFIEHLQQERQQSSAANLVLLQKQGSDLKERVAGAERALAEYAQSNKLISLSQGDGNGSIVKQIDGLAELLAQATSRRVRSESVLDQAKSLGISENAAFDDDTTRQLVSSLRQAETEYATLGQSITPAHPDMLALGAKITAIRKALAEERKRTAKGLQSSYESDKSAEMMLRKQIAGETENAQEVSKRFIEYNILRKEADSLRDLYQSVLKQVKEIEISAANTASTVFVSDYATFPTSASAPKVQLIIVLLTLLGLGAGLVIAIVLESLDNTLKGSTDIPVALDLPVLGAVPQFGALPGSTPNKKQGFIARALPWKKGEASQQAGAPQRPPYDSEGNDSQVPVASDVITIAAPPDAVAEALRNIRAGILLSSADHAPRVIMVTSAVKGEGKTTIISNLAATLAQASHRTLMIDGDLRMSRLGSLFGLPPTSKGLTDCLAGHCALGDVIHHTSIPGLDILLAGNRAPNPSELLGSNSMKQLISDALTQYEFILLDSAPVLPVADGLLLSRLVDGVLLVVRSRFTERKVAKEARRRLLRAGSRILGVVLNDLDTKTAENFDLVTYGDYIESIAEG